MKKLFYYIRSILLILIIYLIFNKYNPLEFIKKEQVITNEQKIEEIDNNAIKSIDSQINTGREAKNPGPLQKILDENDTNKYLSYEKIIEHTNQERINAGLKILRTNELLNESSKFKSEDMNNRQYFEHDSPDGKGVQDLADLFKYKYVIIGENLAMGNFQSEEKIVEAWMNSPGHRANILNPKYTEIGVGIIYGKWKDQDVLFAVQHFGKPLSDCPKVDANLKEVIDQNQFEIDKLISSIESSKNKIDAIKTPNKDYYDMVAGYNDLVNKYNSLINETRSKIDIYNQQISLFNKCSQ